MVIYMYIAPGQGKNNPWVNFFFKTNILSICQFSEVFPFNDILQKGIKNYGSLYLACNERKVFFSLPLTKVGIHFGHVRMCATPCPISLIIFILDLGPSYTDKLLEFRWVQIAHLS